MGGLALQELLIILVAFGVPVILVVAIVQMARRRRARQERLSPRPSEMTDARARLLGSRFQRQSALPRLGAFILDAIVWFICTALIATAISATAGLSANSGGREIVIAVTLLVTGFAYFVGQEATMGRTLGKRVLGMRVLAEDGTPCGWRKAILRNLTKPLALYSVVGLVITLVSMSGDEAQPIGDRLAGTIVVRETGPADALRG